MVKLVNTAKRVMQLSSAILDVPLPDIHFTDISEAFPWLRQGELIWARTLKFKAAVFWARQGLEPIQLNGSQPLGILARLLVRQTGGLTKGVSAAELAEAIRCLTVEPRGYVCTPKFRAWIYPYLRFWVRGNNAEDRERLFQLCNGPVLKRSDDEAWSLEFNYLNPKGGVESWSASGDALEIHQAESSDAVEQGTYLWPMS